MAKKKKSKRQGNPIKVTRLKADKQITTVRNVGNYLLSQVRGITLRRPNGPVLSIEPVLSAYTTLKNGLSISLMENFGIDIKRYVQKRGHAIVSFSKSQGAKQAKQLKPIIQAKQFGTLILIVLAISAVLVLNFITVKHNGSIRKPTVLSSQTNNTADTSDWCVMCRATTITIPSIVFEDNEISQMNFDNKQKTWPTPVSGIATPAETVPNNIIIFGHSKWFGKESHFARISALKPGDEIIVTDQYGKHYTFVVQKLALMDRNDGDAVHAKDNQQLTLLTSARYNGEWLLPTQVDPATVDLVKDDTKYAIFVVTALPKS